MERIAILECGLGNVSKLGKIKNELEQLCAENVNLRSLLNISQMVFPEPSLSTMVLSLIYLGTEI